MKSQNARVFNSHVRVYLYVKLLKLECSENHIYSQRGKVEPMFYGISSKERCLKLTLLTFPRPRFICYTS